VANLTRWPCDHQVFPELKGKLNGHAIRVPMLNASITDVVLNVQRPTSKDEATPRPCLCLRVAPHTYTAPSPSLPPTPRPHASKLRIRRAPSHVRVPAAVTADAQVNAMLEAATAAGAPLGATSQHGPILGFETRCAVPCARVATCTAAHAREYPRKCRRPWPALGAGVTSYSHPFGAGRLFPRTT